MPIVVPHWQRYQCRMPYDAFSHVDHWVFDLDNTLYPRSVRLFDQIEVHMANFVVDKLGVDHDEAHRLRRHYWETHGTTLAGLMHEHGVDPEEFLTLVHDIDLSHVEKDEQLRANIAALPGRKIIYTNGSRAHGHKVSAARGLEGIFDAIYGIEDANYAPKPKRAAFDRIFAVENLTPIRAAMFEDDHRNLAVPHELGMKTVLVHADDDGDHVHHRTDDLPGFLAQLVRS